LREIAELEPDAATARMQQIYAEPIKPELITERLRQMREAGVTVAGALSPQRTQQHWKTVVDAGVDLFVIRGTTVSAEHVSGRAEPLNLKRFIYELDVPVIVGGAASYTAALHLMRTGAARRARRLRRRRGAHDPHRPRHPRPDGLGRRRRRAAPAATTSTSPVGRYVHVIADGGVGTIR
jgi:IMP dehydrogenase